jgi:ABC-type Co2+ transport system permease subunit
VLTLHYVSWERQLGFAMLAVLAGMGAFARWARRRPWRTSLLVVALLALGAPLWLSGPALALANAFLFGWLLALALWCLWRLAEKISTFGADLNGKEAVV